VYQCFVNIDLFRRILIPYNVNKHVYVPVTYVGRCILIIISNSMCLGVRRPFSWPYVRTNRIPNWGHLDKHLFSLDTLDHKWLYPQINGEAWYYIYLEAFTF